VLPPCLSAGRKRYYPIGWAPLQAGSGHRRQDLPCDSDSSHALATNQLSRAVAGIRTSSEDKAGDNCAALDIVAAHTGSCRRQLRSGQTRVQQPRTGARRRTGRHRRWVPLRTPTPW